jgi:transcriptional antiterminator NusG
VENEPKEPKSGSDTDLEIQSGANTGSPGTADVGSAGAPSPPPASSAPVDEESIPLPDTPSFAPPLDPHELPAQPGDVPASAAPVSATDAEEPRRDTPSFAPPLDPHELPAQPPESPAQPDAAAAPQPDTAAAPQPEPAPYGASAEPLAAPSPDRPVPAEQPVYPTTADYPPAAGTGSGDAATAAEAPLETTTDAAPAPPSAENAAPAPAPVTPSAAASHKWYVVHVYSGYEQKAKLSLHERIKQSGMESCFGEILIPMESVQETRAGSTRVTNKTFYPGYIFVQMTLNDEAWHVVRDTPKVTGFVGGRYPRPVPPPEIQSVVQQVEEGAAKPRPQVVFQQGDHVRVIDGAFANFTGAVEEVKPEKQKVRVLVSIFGRATPVELDYSQVEKTV